MDQKEDVVTLFVQVTKKELPPPGSWTSVKMSNGMIAQLWNLRDGETLQRQSKSLGYIPVATTAQHAEVVHAAITRRRNKRNHPERFTLCDRNGDRVVIRQLHSLTLDDVTCKQCHSQLKEDGVVD